VSRIKVYLSDEGFGHVMRQRAILMELGRLRPDLDLVVQTRQQLAYAREVLPAGIRFVEKFNNVITAKSESGSLDVPRTHRLMAGYPEQAEQFVQDELRDADYEFIISDLVPEAFAVARSAGVPNCGVCHFTWDWFFATIFTPEDPIVRAMARYLDQADVVYLPPLTPDGVLQRYAGKAVEIPFIASYDEREHHAHGGRRKVMILDSGTAALARVIRAVLPSLPAMDDMHFYVPAQFVIDAPNVTVIEDLNRIPNVLPDMDLVVSRAGFNTISQCMVHRVPMVLVNEDGNPEIHENLNKVSALGLCVPLTIADYQRRLDDVLRHVFAREYGRILANIRQFKADGAERVARDILKRLGLDAGLAPARDGAGGASCTGGSAIAPWRR